MKNKKILFKLLVIILTFSIITPVFANTQEGYVDASAGLILRIGPGTTYKKITLLENNTNVSILETKTTDDFSTGCPSNAWHHIKTSDNEGYVCSEYIIINTPTLPEVDVSTSEMAQMTDEEFEDYLENQGFPTSYFEKLKKLHKSHPNWIFKAVKAKYTWQNALSQENTKGRSLYQVTSSGVKNGLQGYLNTGSSYYNYSTDTFTALDGSSWFQAHSDTIAYYMDPRNFLTESGIFMFEDLTYYKSYQTNKVVEKILYTDFYKEYIDYYIEAAEKYNVSPVYLAALSRQEVGLNSSTATSGKAGVYNNINYDGYYNFYNIGASSGKNPVYNGLAYSKEEGWDTPQKAIVEGAKWIVNGYISKGQYTRYFQKWNTSPTTTTGIWHQYMTDIKALVSPSSTTATSYNSMGLINEALVFSIPVYIGMPTETTLPPTGNPNNWLKELKIDGTLIENFNSSNTKYDLKEVDFSKESIKIEASTINSNASVDGDGEINLLVGNNTIDILVTAQNGSKKTYTINITRKEQIKEPDEIIEEVIPEISISNILTNLSIKNTDNHIYGFKLGTNTTTLVQNILSQNSNSLIKITTNDDKNKTTDTLSTGDKVTITSNNETKTYEIIIYGDIDGDGKISAKDLLLMRKYLLNEKQLSGVYLEAAKLNKSSSVSAKDLLLLRKYLLGTIQISQV